MRTSLFRRIKENNRGVAAIEFAVILPILVFLVMGILEFGWLFNGWIAMRSAAREGARVAVAVKDLNETKYITDAVKKHLENPDSFFPALIPAIDQVQAQVSDPVLAQGNDFGVTITATGEIKPLVGFFVGSQSYTLTGKATMRIE